MTVINFDNAARLLSARKEADSLRTLANSLPADSELAYHLAKLVEHLDKRIREGLKCLKQNT